MKKVYYDYTYIAPTPVGAPNATPSTGTYYAGSYMSSQYITSVTSSRVPE